MKALLLVLAIFCLLYYFVCASFAGFGAAQLFIWPAASTGCLLVLGIWWLTEKRGIIFPLWSKLLLAAVALFCAALFLWGESMIFSCMFEKGKPNLECVIVLGAKVNGERPSKALLERVECAAEYLKENPDTKAILSGGQGAGENITEAECMFRYLVKEGIDESRLLKEERSTSTRENLLFSYELLENTKAHVGIITHNYHVYRSLLLARRTGFSKVSAIAAPSRGVMQLHYLIRECAAVLKERVIRNG